MYLELWILTSFGKFTARSVYFTVGNVYYGHCSKNQSQCDLGRLFPKTRVIGKI